MQSLPPISRIVRFNQICPFCTFEAFSKMPSPTSREPVNEMNRVSGCVTIVSPTLAPGPGTKLTTSFGNPASCRHSSIFAAMTGDVLAGLRHTVFPHTAAAEVMPVQIASGKFHGGITTPTPSGM
ncbi:MAG: hypothetical protein FLDDKLPJ_02127 [Phycisphaerae bacterium]|nr:hypothetical protein [Phycisphaerae bacterium]